MKSAGEAFVGTELVTLGKGTAFLAYVFDCPCAAGNRICCDTALGWEVAVAEYELHRAGDEH